MSKITLAPDVSGSGTFTIAAPDSSTDRTLTLPDETGTVFTDAGGTMTGALALPAGGLNVGSGQLAVDASGRVTMSSQPAFSAYGANTGGSQYFGNINIGDIARFNRGNHYSTTTKRFTAPIAGAYHFSAGALKYSGNTVSIFLQINGATNIAQNYAEGASGLQVSSTSDTIYLNAGDYVTAYAQNSSWYDNGPGTSPYNWFSGYLIG